MKPGKELPFLDLLRALSRNRIRHLIIGRRAVILYGGPVLTADHDLWIDPTSRKATLLLLSDDLGLEISRSPDTRSPFVTAYSGMRKYDLFFFRKVTNREGESIEFERCHRASSLIADPAEDLAFRVPCIEDLIRLKKIREPNVKDEQDIAYLLKARALLKKSGGRNRR